ncbi:phenylpropionate dioxygenase-like ring-hydroxylating dioxygenase large terminal subunit [Breoghania corrubedonensis]|uniref:Phenylpropionate dioxygenase-like ring-hydroxylating dioxygenase large terminal subunit n=1 Tax=Breoghania corrubedonensis TaxID=665038 RepID=A0A2T5UYN3_9HYPH|nr:aromatic ring-hydroxylating dioxygenase subunit alpha [Breoghania corrubedonensis]PTW56607.1 phenylpropionate dioxygenase-like ring-hydroxylating dioxygenase large terminal subunit [Breoghania corrubedonensis]
MGKYASDPQALKALVKPECVHRDVYIDPDVFQLEMKRLFANTWVYVGHASQIPNPGDYLTTDIGDQPVLASRHGDGSIHVLYNRCPHKGTKIASEPCGNTGKFFRCPYHAWSFKTDGKLLAIPMKKGYEGTGLKQSDASRGLKPVGATHVHRDFIFARLAPEGIGFEDFFGESLTSIDNMVDRSPEGKLVLEGAPLRYMHTCNWKMLVENQTDTCHPMVAHESSAGTAVSVWEREKEKGGPKPMAVELYAPFMSSYDFFEGMGLRVWPNGHGHTGVNTSIHADYSAVPGYFEQMVEAYGEERAKKILGENRHNTVYFPNIMIKGPIQTLRVFKPIAADRTLVESYTFRLVGAPDMLFERTLMYNRFINAPTSIVGHDDLEMYERAQQGLHADGQEWVDIRRLYEPGEAEDVTDLAGGTSERQMRNQFHAWLKFMNAPGDATSGEDSAQDREAAE